jgi:hypothetical protein
MKLWIVGKNIADLDAGVVWEFQGVYDSEEKALSACISPNHFIGPAALNKSLPDETQQWPGCIYPVAVPLEKESWSR